MKERDLSFEAIIVAIEDGKLLDVLSHPNPKYINQFIFVVEMNDHIVCVPFVEDKETIFLKTAFYSRKAKKDYLRGSHHEKN